MKIVGNILTHINSLTKSEFDRHVLYIMLGVVLFAAGGFYFTSTTSEEYVQTINSLHTQSRNAGNLSVRFATAQREKRRVTHLLSENKTFEIKSFVENFFRDHNIRPTSDWAVITSNLPGNDQLEELSLKVRISGQSMENVVTLLSNLAQKEIVYVRELSLEKEASFGGRNNVSIELVLATLRFTARREE